MRSIFNFPFSNFDWRMPCASGARLSSLHGRFECGDTFRRFSKSKIGNRKSAIPALLAGFVLAVTGCQKAEDADTLVVYSAGPRGLADWICSEFQEATGKRVKLYSATTGQIMAKLQAEKHHPYADVVVLASPTAAQALKVDDRFRPLPNLDGLAIRQGWIDNDGYFAGTAASALGIATLRHAYNPDLEWDDVFSGKLSGRTIMPSPSQSGTSAEFVAAFSLTVGAPFWEGMKAAKERGLQISGPNSQAITGLLLGSHDTLIAAADYLIFAQIADGKPLAMHFPRSGSPVVTRPIAILKDTHAPELAEEFVRFYFSPTVQQQIAATHLIPADENVPLSASRLQVEELNALPLDPNETLSTLRESLRRFRYEVEMAQVPQ